MNGIEEVRVSQRLYCVIFLLGKTTEYKKETNDHYRTQLQQHNLFLETN